MNCKEFRENMPAFSSEQLEQGLRVQCEKHITDCVSCLDLWLSNNPNEYRLESHTGKKLAKSILQSTNTNTCKEAEDFLVDYVDENLSRIDSDLVSMHLDNCFSCNQTALELLQLKHDLPQLSQQKPPDDLLEGILRQTLPWSKLLARKFSKTTENFSNLLLRPRFSLEASFLGTFLWLALFGLPSNVATWALTEPSNFNFDAIPTIEVDESIANLQENLGTDALNLQPIIASGIESLGNLSSALIENGINKTRQGSNELWQTLTEVLPPNPSENPVNE